MTICEICRDPVYEGEQVIPVAEKTEDGWQIISDDVRVIHLDCI